MRAGRTSLGCCACSASSYSGSPRWRPRSSRPVAADRPRSLRGPGTAAESRLSRPGRLTLADPVVVEPHQRDHVDDVGVVVDPACGHPLTPRKHRVVDDPAFIEQLAPYVLREAEMSCVIAVQMADL